MGLYLLAPVLSRWLNYASRTEIEFYLGLWGISLCFPLFRPVVNINTGNTGILYYFTGYAGYISSALVSYLISFLPGAQCIIGHTYYAKHR